VYLGTNLIKEQLNTVYKVTFASWVVRIIFLRIQIVVLYS